jgi:hypothetical protein
MPFSRFFVLLFCLAAPWLRASAQGPVSGFMPRKGELALAVGYGREHFNDYFDATGNRIFARINARSWSAFLEYGLEEKLAVIATAPHIDNQGDNRGWQDGSLWLKYLNDRTEGKNGAANWITAIGFTFPLSKYPIDNNAAIGNRAFVFNGRLTWQFTHRSGWFFAAQSGFDFQMAPEARAAWPLLFRTGYGATLYYAEVWFEAYKSLDGATMPGSLAAGAGSSWTRAGGTLYFPLRAWLGIQGNYALVLGGRNIGLARRWGVGVVLGFRKV